MKKIIRAKQPAKRKDRQETEKRLLDAARDVFSHYGFDGATTKLIATRAKVNEALITRYFESKEGLFKAVTIVLMESMHSKELAYTPCESLEEELTRFMLDETGEMNESVDFAKIALSHVWMKADRMADITTNLPMRNGDPRLLKRLDRLQKLGKIKPAANLSKMAQVVMFHSFGSLFLGQSILHHDEKHSRELALFFIKGLVTEWGVPG